ncbi:MAG: type II secretion system GspH family protein [Oscillospiraceae bacterium]|nr:type II secretion system GspH family protein [Oscillospiraceae bacterium]
MKLQKILKNRKGFTLMELIIVLVIVAILAAALIPSFLNFATRAREESLYAQARVGMVAAQVLITESGKPIADAKDDRVTLTYDQFISRVRTSTEGVDFYNLVVDDVDNPDGFSDFVIAKGGLRIVGITYEKNTDEKVIITPPA